MNYKIFFLFVILSISDRIYSQDWSGNYLSISGKYNLVIDYENKDDEMLSFEVLDLAASEKISSAVAFFKDDVATTHSIHVKNECITKLSKSTQGIFVSDFCGGSDSITGFYQKISDIDLAFFKIIPSI